MVYVTADAALSERVSRVRVSVDGAGDEEEVILEPGRSIEAEQDPMRVPLVPKGGDASRPFEITVELFEEAGPNELTSLGQQTAVGGYVDKELREVWLAFDDTCEHALCAEGYRCQDGMCVENCVDPSAAGTTTRSEPVACDTPCTAQACVDDDQFTCDDGIRVLTRRCGYGCDDEAESCDRLHASNTPIPILEDDDPFVDMSLAIDVIARPPESVVLTFQTEAGAIIQQNETTEENEAVCIFCNLETHGIGFYAVDAASGVYCDGTTPLKYGVFVMRSLRVFEDATIVATGNNPLIIITENDIVIEGRINVSAKVGGSEVSPTGAASCGAGQGEGRGMSAEGSGAGGGGSFGSLGGDGGPQGASPGGGAGVAYGTDNLVPLLGGSGGGSGGVFGGRSGGAIQLSSLTGRILFGPLGLVEASGTGGSGAPETSGGGGGSGGAILLEAGSVICPVEAERAFFGAPGGGGGGGALFLSGGTNGDPNDVPAAGGSFSGGDGSDLDGVALSGGSRGGGGGGAGRVRINTLAGGPIECGTILEPISFGEVDIVE